MCMLDETTVCAFLGLSVLSTCFTCCVCFFYLISVFLYRVLLFGCGVSRSFLTVYSLLSADPYEPSVGHGATAFPRKVKASLSGLVGCLFTLVPQVLPGPIHVTPFGCDFLCLLSFRMH